MRSPDFFALRRPRRALVEFGLALAIGAAAAERRTLCKNLAVVLVLAARPIVAAALRCADAPASRCGLRAARALARGDPARGRSNFGRSPCGRSSRERENRGRSSPPRSSRGACRSAACRNCARRRGRDGNCAGIDRRSSRFCHGLELPRSDRDRAVAKILARAAIGRTAREFLVAAKFSLRPIATGAIAIARRPGAEGPIALRPVAVLAKTFAARRVGPLLAAAFARGIGLLVAEFPVGETRGRTGIVAIARVALAIPARRTVVAIEIRTVTARRVRALLAATIFARLERTLFAIAAA